MSDKYDLRIPLGIVRVEKRIELREYNEDLGGSFLTVWVNIDNATMARWNEYKDEEAKLDHLLAESQSDHPAPDLGARITAQTQHLEALAVPFYADLWAMPHEHAQALYEVNNPLFTWCAQRTWALISKYRAERPKGSGGG